MTFVPPTPRAATGTALVTGASSGIGEVYARRLAARGHDLVLVARRREQLQALADELVSAHGINTQVLVADLTRTEDLDNVARRLAADDIQVFINNAGYAVAGMTDASTPENLLQQVLLNVVAPTVLLRAVVPGLKARRRGAIINIASVAALTGDRPRVGTGYNASKAYLLSFAEGLDAELREYGVYVQALLPGVTRTALWGNHGEVDAFPPDQVMSVDDLVDAALVAWDMGEHVTVPALEDLGRWQAFMDARHALYPDLSHREPASRYRRPPG